MSNHTPGPWTLNGFFETGSVHGIMSGTIDERGNHVNSQQVLPFYDCDPQGQNYQRHMADKLLIEAAPELLRVLKEIISQIDQGGSGGKVFSRDNCITEARAAIAKATGDQT